ncbi:hypothetical protein KOR42_43470 [Thalassoglobus neptunius]|uniref:Uncharacterized protein n=1 Tax=Thalassoglobus neptunius TaxID=1938619 RepID=A0A5C5W6Q5_9PLAN|nr:hypothetical protein [Thalassoglobus neptunius]TWT46370.1 hypothetical protein KOR42_43470 [Thalassoglobus neptunius]
MFCSQCGVEADGKFCFACGHRLHQIDGDIHESNAAPPENELIAPPSYAVNWEDDICYEQVLQADAVRSAIAEHGSKAIEGFSGEDCLAIYDKIVPSPIPLAKLATVIQPLYASFGVRTGKTREGTVNAPPGVVLARALCSLAKHAQPFQRVEQAEDRCTLIAEFPSSIWALKGEIRVTVTKQVNETHVSALTDIPGQAFDWGKSTKALERLFADLHSEMGIPRTRQHRAA